MEIALRHQEWKKKARVARTTVIHLVSWGSELFSSCFTLAPGTTFRLPFLTPAPCSAPHGEVS